MSENKMVDGHPSLKFMTENALWESIAKGNRSFYCPRIIPPKKPIISKMADIFSGVIYPRSSEEYLRIIFMSNRSVYTQEFSYEPGEWKGIPGLFQTRDMKKVRNTLGGIEQCQIFYSPNCMGAFVKIKMRDDK